MMSKTYNELRKNGFQINKCIRWSMKIPYIKNQINALGLNNYEFYFYVVPFNDATNERASIIDEMIGGI